MRRRTLTIALAAGLAAPVLAAAAPAHAAACKAPFFAPYVADIAKIFPGQRVTASVVDLRTGCRYDLNAGMRITTASVVKAGILGTALLQAQDAGHGLTAREQTLAAGMIRYSNNTDTSALYALTGGVRGMNAFDKRVGATQTTPSSAFGATVTTARDRTLVSEDLLAGGGPLGAAARSVAWGYMSTVTPTQTWGISAGVPKGYDVAQKNGFYPMAGHGWRVGSTGFVRQHGTNTGYVITVMTDQDPTQHRGIEEVETVSREVAATLTTGAPAPRAVDRSTCTQTRAGESWGTVTRSLGLPASAAGAVETVSGGNPSPLSGQWACSPYLR